jgi:hypothetical protein
VAWPLAFTCRSEQVIVLIPIDGQLIDRPCSLPIFISEHTTAAPIYTLLPCHPSPPRPCQRPPRRHSIVPPSVHRLLPSPIPALLAKLLARCCRIGSLHTRTWPCSDHPHIPPTSLPSPSHSPPLPLVLHQFALASQTCPRQHRQRHRSRSPGHPPADSLRFHRRRPAAPQRTRRAPVIPTPDHAHSSLHSIAIYRLPSCSSVSTPTSFATRNPPAC